LVEVLCPAFKIDLFLTPSEFVHEFILDFVLVDALWGDSGPNQTVGGFFVVKSIDNVFVKKREISEERVLEVQAMIRQTRNGW
jgi:hypothetical protein